MMDDAAIERFRNILLQQRAELQALQESARNSGEVVELDQSRVGRLSRMDAMQSQQMARETARRRQQQLQKIEGALRRIETGDFGYCHVCGEEIAEHRLDIDPAATRCIRCAEA